MDQVLNALKEISEKMKNSYQRDSQIDRQSDSIKELVAALAKAQGKMKPAVFNKVNPHFKNRYADFTSVMDACRGPLAENGLSVLQYCETINDRLVLVTMLAHTSGQYIKSFYPLNPRSVDSQAIGSAMTYAKRYSLSALIGVVADDDDDDGNTATRVEKVPQEKSIKETEPKKEVVKMTLAHVNMIKRLEEQLNDYCKGVVNKFLLKEYGTDILEDIADEAFQKIFTKFENAKKFQQSESEKLEVISA